MALTQPEAVERWARDRAIDLWVSFALPDVAAAARDDGALITRVDETPSSWAVFEAMGDAGVDDVRRVGVLAATPSGLSAGRAAGAQAVVGIAATSAETADLLLVEPDAVVTPSGFGSLYDERYSSGRLLRPQVLLNPGPALTTERVKRAAAGVDLCHREPEYTVLDRRIRDRLRAVAGVGDDWAVALLSGSGTGAAEASLRAAVRPQSRVLVAVNGVYGERLLAMATRAGIDVVIAEYGWTEPADPAEIAGLLETELDVDAVAVVHHETTTGLLNPVEAIAAVARDRGVRVVVDGISSFGAEELTLEGSGIDFLVCSSNKCLQGLPGAAFVLVSPAGRERLEAVPATSVYLDLAAYLRGSEAGSVPFTPAIPALASLDAALDELLAIGADEHRCRYAERAAALDLVLDGLGLEPIVAPASRSRTVRAVPLPGGVSYEPLHDALKRDGYVIYAGQGRLAPEIFRVCCMGALGPEIIESFGGRLAAELDRAAATV